MRILVIEDEVALANNIAQLLRESCGYAVDCCHDGIDGLHQATTEEYDLLILDIMLPGMDGREILASLRNQGSKIPILMLSARGELTDLVEGLNSGADDYLRKPFQIMELLARCKALIRRNYQQLNPILSAQDLTLNTQTRAVLINQRIIDLTPMEFKTLEYLLHRINQVATKTEISEHLYDLQWERYSNVIESYISSLRKKLNPAQKNQYIKTVRGHGYVIND